MRTRDSDFIVGDYVTVKVRAIVMTIVKFDAIIITTTVTDVNSAAKKTC